MKKIFTLLELLIVLLIIWILMLIWLNLLSNQLEKNIFQLQVEKTINFFKQTAIQNMSKSTAWNQVYNQLLIEIISGSDYINKYLYSSIDKKIFEKLIYKNAFISDININWIPVQSWNIIFQSYNHNSMFQTISNQYTSWNLIFYIYSKNKKFKKCLKLILDTSKIIQC